jgi:hypothetical protein
VSAALSIPVGAFELVVAGQTIEAAGGADLAMAGHAVTVVPSSRSGFDIRRDKRPQRRSIAPLALVESEADLDKLATVFRQMPKDGDGAGHSKVAVCVTDVSGGTQVEELKPEEALRIIEQLKSGNQQPPGDSASPTTPPPPLSREDQYRAAQMQHSKLVDEAKAHSKKHAENVRTTRVIELLRDKRAAKAARRDRRKRTKRAKAATSTTTGAIASPATTTAGKLGGRSKAALPPSPKSVSIFGGFAKGFFASTKSPPKSAPKPATATTSARTGGRPKRALRSEPKSNPVFGGFSKGFLK